MRVFISHITEEAAIARVLKEWIESTFGGACNVFVSSDRGDLPAGSRWLSVIEDALRDAQALLVICSANSILRPWINFEAGCGWIKGIPIIPLCHSGQPKDSLPPPLSLFQGLDIDDTDFTSELMAALANHLGVQKLPRLHHAEMREELRTAIGSTTAAAAERGESKLRPVPTKRDLGRELSNLTPKEYMVFAQFVDRDTKVATFCLTDSESETALTAHTLAIRGHLYLVSRAGNLWFETLTYAIQEPEFAFFKAHPEMLEPGRKLEKDEESRRAEKSREG